MKEQKGKRALVFSLLPRFAEIDEMDASSETRKEHAERLETEYAALSHAEAGEIQNLKSAIRGHGEQTILPDECQYGDNDLCYVEA